MNSSIQIEIRLLGNKISLMMSVYVWVYSHFTTVDTNTLIPFNSDIFQVRMVNLKF